MWEATRGSVWLEQKKWGESSNSRARERWGGADQKPCQLREGHWLWLWVRRETWSYFCFQWIPLATVLRIDYWQSWVEAGWLSRRPLQQSRWEVTVTWTEWWHWSWEVVGTWVHFEGIPTSLSFPQELSICWSATGTLMCHPITKGMVTSLKGQCRAHLWPSFVFCSA